MVYLYRIYQEIKLNFLSELTRERFRRRLSLALDQVVVEEKGGHE
jgi:hypothetical protein